MWPERTKRRSWSEPLIWRKHVRADEVIPFFRWSARVLGVIVAGFSLYMFIGETFFGTRHASSHPIEPGALWAHPGRRLCDRHVRGTEVGTCRCDTWRSVSGVIATADCGVSLANRQGRQC